MGFFQKLKEKKKAKEELLNAAKNGNVAVDKDKLANAALDKAADVAGDKAADLADAAVDAAVDKATDAALDKAKEAGVKNLTKKIGK